MSLLNRVEACHQKGNGDLLPFRVVGSEVGRISPEIAERLARYGDVFRAEGDAIVLNPTLSNYQERTRAVEDVLRRTYEANHTGFGRWCGETTPVVPAFDQPALFEIERAAVGSLGVLTCGVHLNGYVMSGGVPKMWIAKRAKHISAQPGEWDQIAAGFVPTGAPLLPKLVAEAHEEAGLAPEETTRAIACGFVTFRRLMSQGVQRGRVYIYDLELHPTFQPANDDGDVECFELASADKVIARLIDPGHFKFDCALVAIDFLIRHGAVGPDWPDYEGIVAALREPIY